MYVNKKNLIIDKNMIKSLKKKIRTGLMEAYILFVLRKRGLTLDEEDICQ
jgi:hypothetical protein